MVWEAIKNFIEMNFTAVAGRVPPSSPESIWPFRGVDILLLKGWSFNNERVK
jgi:hypothetical protein